ncbi:response regulator transcription factor [Cellulosilyticum sp. ST5]|uniref:Stage 0 sporulation protein A homolog n=1 Tax=Cellulosilyticum lentocellum (strain ATCC 49066 / DSM 5427 / NCIMB 11756 / RHM5) TaxID=642492 RepID=F2JJ07_CELLD|nr:MULTISPECIES: response regulator transcription factor [Cellulosilyticum]ADZ83166.1 two component transcriptional regulator, winged helix family [Cellulosilyticum lentocellum DSM 5427]QEH68651.1 response regulator transcription factor [Cellulosilyticum sp. WCF-2]
MNILVIEDEERVADIMTKYLEKEGYKVFTCYTGRSGLDCFYKNKIDIVLLDLMLPDIQGEEICAEMRQVSNVHIFMITAKGTLDSKIDGFDRGADEYLVKPISPREVVARVKALDTRKQREENKEMLVFDKGHFKIFLQERIVQINNEEITLTPNEFDLLYELASAPGRVFSRDQLIEAVMGIDFDGFDRTIDVHIKNLRKKIETDTKNPRYIKTVTGVGYKFEGEHA